MHLSAPIFRLKRRARLLARRDDLPLHAALDRIAQAEGFVGWSHLAATASAPSLLPRLRPGQLVLLAARPGHGKTLLGLSLLIEAVGAKRPAFFFTLDYTAHDVLTRLRDLGQDPARLAAHLTLDTSDEICAGHVIDRIGPDAPGAVALIDYLQLLDQRRSNPPLAEQVAALRNHAQETGAIAAVISQIDRRFAEGGPGFPGPGDVRLPNSLDLRLFHRTCFLHDGAIRVDPAA